MIERDDKFLVERGWASQICYWARGKPSQIDPTYWFVFENEWLWDFVYFECNMNMLFSMFFHDKHNGLKTKYRFLIEWVCISITLTFTAATRDISGAIIASILALIMRNIMLYSFICPCLITRTDHTCFASMCKPFFMYLSGGVAIFCVGLGITFTILGIIFAVREGTTFFNDFIISVCLGYFYGFLIDLSFPFNPFVVTRKFMEGEYKGYAVCAGCCGLYYFLIFCFGQMGLAKWQMERKLVNEKLIELVAIEAAKGPSSANFTASVPSSPSSSSSSAVENTGGGGSIDFNPAGVGVCVIASNNTGGDVEQGYVPVVQGLVLGSAPGSGSGSGWGLGSGLGLVQPTQQMKAFAPTPTFTPNAFNPGAGAFNPNAFNPALNAYTPVPGIQMDR